MYILEPGIRNWHWGTSIPLFGWPRYCWLGIHSNAKRYSAPRNTSSRNVLPPSSVLGGNRPPHSRISLPLALSLTPAWSSTRGGAAAPAEKVGRGGSGGEGRARRLRQRRTVAAPPRAPHGAIELRPPWMPPSSSPLGQSPTRPALPYFLRPGAPSRDRRPLLPRDRRPDPHHPRGRRSLLLLLIFLAAGAPPPPPPLLPPCVPPSRAPPPRGPPLRRNLEAQTSAATAAAWRPGPAGHSPARRGQRGGAFSGETTTRPSLTWLGWRG